MTSNVRSEVFDSAPVWSDHKATVGKVLTKESKNLPPASSGREVFGSQRIAILCRLIRRPLRSTARRMCRIIRRETNARGPPLAIRAQFRGHEHMDAFVQLSIGVRVPGVVGVDRVRVHVELP